MIINKKNYESDNKLNKSKVMIITNELQDNPNGGRELLCKVNFDSLKSLYSDGLVLHELDSKRLKGIRAYINSFRGYINGLNAEVIESIINSIKRNNIKKIFIDGSNLGGLVVKLKDLQPRVEVTVFFHNVESRFFFGSFRDKRTLKALAILVANYLAERRAVKYSDKIICLSDRDSHTLKRLYGRGASHIAPMVLEDKYKYTVADLAPSRSESFALFVGGNFYANKTGIAWFVREVVPHINIPIYIVGRGFETIRSELEVDGKVVVVGAVDILSDWYMRAKFVIAPIFDGSGMKTKVAEALMHGKKIIGTEEAFSGYKNIVEQAGWLCTTADDFVKAIEIASFEINSSYDYKLREIFINNYSMNAGKERLREILSDNLYCQ